MSTYVGSLSVDSAGSSVSAITLTSLTTSGTDRNAYPVFAHRAGTERSGTSVVRTGQADTYAFSAGTKNGNAKTEVWYSSNEPVTTAANLVGTIDSANTSWIFGCLYVSDSNQTTRIGTPVLDETAAGTSLSVNVSSATNGLVISANCIAAAANTIVATGTSHTQRLADEYTSNVYLNIGTKPGETTATLGWSWGGGSLPVVLYGWNAPNNVLDPVNTVPASGVYIPTTSATFTTISDYSTVSVVSGTTQIASVVSSCTAGKGIFTLTGSGTAEISGNQTNSITVTASNDTDYNNTLSTLTFQGATGVHEAVTVNILSSDGTLTDSDNFTVLNDPTSLTLVAVSYADLVAAIQTLYMRLPSGEKSATVTIVATDDDLNVDTQVVTLTLADVGLSTLAKKDFTKYNSAIRTGRRER